MRIHNHVGHDSVRRSGHIVSTQHDANGPFLSMAIRYLVAQFRNAILDHTNLDQAQARIVDDNRHLFHPPARPHLRGQRIVARITLVVRKVGPDNHRRLVTVLPHLDDAILVQFTVVKGGVQVLPRQQLRVGRVADTHLGPRLGVILLRLFVRTVGHGAKQAALKGVVIKDDAVVLIVARPERDGQNNVLTIGHLALSQVIGVNRAAQRGLTIAQNKCGIVEPVLPIGGVEADGLLGLAVPELVARRLIVMRKGDERRHHAENGRGMDLHMRRLGPHLFGEIREKGRVLLIGVNVLENALEGDKSLDILLHREGLFSKGVHKHSIGKGKGGHPCALYEVAPRLERLDALDRRKAPLINPDHGAEGTTAVHVDQNAPIVNGKGRARRIGQNARALKDLEDLGQEFGPHRHSNDAAIQKHGHITRPLRIEHVGRLVDAPLCIQPIQQGVGRGLDGKGRQNAHVFGNTNRGTARRLGRTEIPILTRVETARTLGLHTRVKLENNAAAVTQKVRIGQA